MASTSPRLGRKLRAIARSWWIMSSIDVSRGGRRFARNMTMIMMAKVRSRGRFDARAVHGNGECHDARSREGLLVHAESRLDPGVFAHAGRGRNVHGAWAPQPGGFAWMSARTEARDGSLSRADLLLADRICDRF